MEISVKIRIVDNSGDPFMGPGPLRLLERIAGDKSINRAAKNMHLSYVKALKMLARLEETTGRRFLVRRRGGNKRGGSDLTPYAGTFMAEYRKLEKGIKDHGEARFAAFEKKVFPPSRKSPG
ncbi:MAG: LysR family transcriptional regulator [Pseudomonadota bacterium]